LRRLIHKRCPNIPVPPNIKILILYLALFPHETRLGRKIHMISFLTVLVKKSNAPHSR
jgi:hypothetical protein